MRRTAILRFFGVSLALGLAYAAQYLFDHPGAPLTALQALPFLPPPPFTLAVLALLAGMILFAVAAPTPDATAARAAQVAPSSDDPEHELAVRWQAPEREASQSPPPLAVAESPSGLRRPWAFWLGLGLAVLAAAAYIFNMGLYLGGGETALVRWLWLASILLLLAAQWRWVFVDEVVQHVAHHRRFYLGLALVLLIALALRLYRLDTLPQDLHGDMASHGLQAREILSGATPGLVGVGWADIPLAAFLPTVTTMALTGDTGLIGLNLASVIGGLLSVAGLAVLLLQITDRRVAWIAAVLLAVSYTHIHFSRIAEYMDPVPLAVWSLAFLAIGFRSGHSLPFLLSGMAASAAGLMYYSGRVVIVIIVLFLLYLLLLRRDVLRENWPGLATLALGFVVVMGPMTFYFAGHSDQFLSRTREVLVLSNPDALIHLQGKYGVTGLPAVMGEQIKRTLLTFSFYEDSSTQFGIAQPMLDSLMAPLVALGLAYALAHLRRPANFFLACALLTTLVIGGVLTGDAPFWPRMVFALAPAVALAAVAIDRIWDAACQAFGPETTRIVSVIVVGGLIYIGLQNWLIYYPAVKANGRPRAIVGRAIAAQPVTATVCLVPEGESNANRWISSVTEREIDFFLAPRPGYDVPASQLAAGLPSDHPCLQSGAVWLVAADQPQALQQLQAQFPGGRLETHGPRVTETVVTSYRLP